jgi:hypothetical protein
MNNHPHQLWWMVLGVSLWFVLGVASSLAKTPHPSTLFMSPLGVQSLPATPFFRFPVVPDAPISGSLDHNTASNMVTLYNGRRNTSTAYGYIFNCAEKQMSDFVGCEGPYSGEAACPNSEEVWYNGHKGTDFEYAANWHEPGDTCNLSRFAGITRPVYAPAPGKVQLIQIGDPANGNAIFIKHDLDGDGDYNDDIIRSAYLHFADGSIMVAKDQIVAKGQYLGLGGMTGYASTPHLHFEVQRSTDSEFLTNKWSVDPFGWTGPGSDPWPYANYPLWRYYNYIPAVLKNYCSYGEKLVNGNFNTGDATSWVTSRSNGSDPIVQPYGGTEYGAWLGRYDNNYDQLYQTTCVPTPVSNATLTYWWWISTAEAPGAAAYDHLYVRVYDANGTFLQTLETLSNASSQGQWYFSSFDLRAYAGQTIQVWFEAVNDASLPTNFWIDNVSLSTSP